MKCLVSICLVLISTSQHTEAKESKDCKTETYTKAAIEYESKLKTCKEQNLPLEKEQYSNCKASSMRAAIEALNKELKHCR